MRVHEIINTLEIERQTQLKLLNIRKTVCQYSIPLACELYDFTEEEALRLSDKVDMDFSITGPNIFTLRFGSSVNEPPKDVGFHDTKELQLAWLINQNSNG